MLTEPALLRTARANDFCSALMLDLDYFKSINDRHGHDFGDTCLIQVAKILKNRLRPEDIVARLGGDEFFVLLPETDAVVASDIIAQLHEAFQEMRVCLDSGGTLALSVSIGQTTRHAAHVTLSELLRVSDGELYREKKNRIAWNAGATPVGVRRLDYEAAHVQPSLS